jgi:hypothetical protein
MPLPSGRKTWTLADVLAIHEAAILKNKTANCDVRDWLRLHTDDGTTIEQFEAWRDSDPDRCATSAYLGIRDAHDWDEEPIASELQDYYAERLVKNHCPTAFGLAQKLLFHPVRGGLAQPALDKLKAYMRAHHPHADAFFAQDLAHK